MAHGSGASVGSGLLLVVDDEPTVLNLVSSVLSRRNYTVLTAASAEEALSVLHQQRGIQLALIDIVLPGMSGPELVDRLGTVSPGTKCLLMSGYPMDQVRRLGAFEKRCDFLKKPFMPAQLVGKVQELLDTTG